MAAAEVVFGNIGERRGRANSHRPAGRRNVAEQSSHLRIDPLERLSMCGQQFQFLGRLLTGLKPCLGLVENLDGMLRHSAQLAGDTICGGVRLEQARMALIQSRSFPRCSAGACGCWRVARRTQSREESKRSEAWSPVSHSHIQRHES